MTTKIGRLAKVAISDTDSSYTDIGKITSASLSFAHDIADETNNDSGGYKEAQYADSQASLDLSFKYDSADSGQAELLTGHAAKSKKWVRFRPDETAGELEYRFQATIDDATVDTETGSVEDGSATISSTGTVTKATQT